MKSENQVTLKNRSRSHLPQRAPTSKSYIIFCSALLSFCGSEVTHLLGVPQRVRCTASGVTALYLLAVAFGFTADAVGSLWVPYNFML